MYIYNIYEYIIYLYMYIFNMYPYYIYIYIHLGELGRVVSSLLSTFMDRCSYSPLYIFIQTPEPIIQINS